MKTFSLFRAAAAASLIGLLAACGGSESPSATPVPFASPAMFVAPGQDKITVPLTCTSNPGATSATLVVTSAGDLIFSGAPGTSTAVVEIVKVTFAEATYKYIDSQVNQAGAYIELDNNSKYIYAYWEDDGDDTYFEARLSANSPTYECSLPSGSASFSLKREINEARLAATMLTGVTAMSTGELGQNRAGTYTGGVGYWDNHYDNTVAADASCCSDKGPNQDSIRFFSLNMSTGQMFTSPTGTTPFSAPTNLRLLLPTNTSTYGYFSEEQDLTEKSFNLRIRPADGPVVEVEFSVDGNFFVPEYSLYYCCVNNND